MDAAFESEQEHELQDVAFKSCERSQAYGCGLWVCARTRTSGRSL